MPRKSRGQRSLVGCSPWGHKESDTTEWLKHQEHSNYVPDIWGQEWAPLSMWPPCVYPWLLTTPTLPLWLTQAELSVLNPHPRSSCLFKCNFESQSQILPLPGSPLDQTSFALCWTAKSSPVLSMCVHAAWLPLLLSKALVLAPSSRKSSCFTFPWHQTQGEMLSDGFTVILMETPEWRRSFLLGSCSLEMQWFYDKRSEFQKGEFWKWLGYNFIF